MVKLAQTTLNYLQNRNLFSNHYLESLIKDSPEWNEDVSQAFAQAKEIYDSRRDSWKNLDESMLEQFLIKPILEEVLGHHYIPQAKVEKGSRRPDYAFFENDAALSEALENKETDDIYLKAIAVGDAKRWKVLLDKKVKGSSGSFEFQKLIDILVKNKKKLNDGYDPKSPTNYKHLQEWYDDSMDKLQPLMGRIEATDGLIDQIVYRLYGLSDEEIKIVEESI